MYDIPIRYLASVFLDAASIVPTPELTVAFLDRFKKFEMLPISVEEKETPRLGFTAVSRGLTVALLGSRFDVSVRPLRATETELAARNMGDFRGFCSLASEVLCSALEYFERKGQRLAAVQEGLLPEMSNEKLEDILSRLLVVPDDLTRSDVFEWDYRLAYKASRRFGSHEETTFNLVTALRRNWQLQVTPDQKPRPFEGLQVNLDINTVPTDIRPRFDCGAVQAFLEEAPSWHEAFEQRIAKLMGIMDDES